MMWGHVFNVPMMAVTLKMYPHTVGHGWAGFAR
jgi:hypothetical protein